MQYGGLIGNEHLKKTLTAALSAGRLSHSYLICGPEGSGKKMLARYLSAAAQCTASGEKPCFACAQCRKVMAGTHPDVVTVDDPKKQAVPVEVIRSAKADVFIRPNEGRRKIYLIPRAQNMGPAAQNALLKILEEPPEYGMFLLLTDHAEKLLPTVRSRCVELALSPVGREQAAAYLHEKYPQAGQDAIFAAYTRSGGFLGQAAALLESGDGAPAEAAALCRAFSSRDRLLLAETLCPMEKWKRDRLIPVLEQTQRLLADAMAVKSGFPAGSPVSAELSVGRTADEILRAYRTVREAAEAAGANVGVGHVCGMLAVRLR